MQSGKLCPQGHQQEALVHVHFPPLGQSQDRPRRPVIELLMIKEEKKNGWQKLTDHLEKQHDDM